MLEKIWDQHVVDAPESGPTILYIDLQLVHEVTSPQAFEGLRLAGRSIRRPERTIATPDHNIPTTDRSVPIADPIALKQIETLRSNCADFGVTLFDIDDVRQGIVHVIGPENGYTQPGMTIVCGDSHTATHGAFGALAFGIGTSEVEHVLATQTLLQQVPRSDGRCELRVDGEAAAGRHGERLDPLLDRPAHDRRQVEPGTCIEYTGRLPYEELSHGREDDGLQYDDRGRCAGRDDRSRYQTTLRLLAGATRSSRRSNLTRPLRVGRNCPVRQWALPYDKLAMFFKRPGHYEPQVTWGTNPGPGRSAVS